MALCLIYLLCYFTANTKHLLLYYAKPCTVQNTNNLVPQAGKYQYFLTNFNANINIKFMLNDRLSDMDILM